ncbi:sulfatase-like hydrolase/transferase [Lacrimispora sp.]|uniref:sulfatase-like hydrolase/transferase n=1 Tax=Lacrimispora sp. TaxID=2719234 RepID=UPI00285EBE7E|nr:sulfatase-like hydrolase/transferase [Lacrimispora sp.]MDR7810442.1 sulfatase-like hydrolase/transferase [Lacrimispora sp.]
MNVITILSDEHSYEMMHFVNHSLLRTPNLDRLAGEGIVFDSFYSTCPVCAPARASFFTGNYVHQLGTWDNSTPYDGTVVGISHHAVRNGCTFACIGKTHFHHEGSYEFTYESQAGYMHRPDIGCYFRDQKIERIGAEKRFERIGIKTEESFDDRVLAESLSWLEAHRDEDNFMLYIGFLDPHFPFYVKQEHWDYYNSRITEIPDELRPPFTSLNPSLEWMRTYFKCEQVPEETIRRVLVGYHCAIEEFDERLGVLLDAIDRLGLRGNTAVCYSSDHGEQLGYHGMWWKCCMFEQSAHIPLIFRVPETAAKRIPAPASLADLYPTFCDLLNIPQPEGIAGHSLMKLITDGIDPDRPDFAFSEYHAHGIPDGMFMIRWRQYKYVFYCGDKPQLFNLKKDPGEHENLLETSSDDPKVQRISDSCHRRLLSVCDPHAVNARAKEFQKRMKKEMGLEDYASEMGQWVPRPEAIVPGKNKII